jgi:hypothetical protein
MRFQPPLRYEHTTPKNSGDNTVSAPLELGLERPETSLMKFCQNPDIQKKFRAMMAADINDSLSGKHKRRRSVDLQVDSEAISNAIIAGENACDVAILHGIAFDLAIERSQRLAKNGRSPHTPFRLGAIRRLGYVQYAKNRLDLLKSRNQIAASFELPSGFFGRLKHR